MEITQTLPQKYQVQNYTVTLNTIPHTSLNTRCQLNIQLRHFVSNTNKPKLHESCGTKSKPYFMLQIKTFFVVLLKKSFVIHLCCLKNIVLKKLTNFPKRYNLTHFVDNIFNGPKFFFFCTMLNDFKYFYLLPIIYLHIAKWPQVLL